MLRTEPGQFEYKILFSLFYPAISLKLTGRLGWKVLWVSLPHSADKEMGAKSHNEWNRLWNSLLQHLQIQLKSLDSVGNSEIIQFSDIPGKIQKNENYSSRHFLCIPLILWKFCIWQVSSLTFSVIDIAIKLFKPKLLVYSIVIKWLSPVSSNIKTWR